MNTQQLTGSQVGSQVSAPAPQVSQVSKPASTNGSQVSKPASKEPQTSTPTPQNSQVTSPAQPSLKRPQDHCRNYLPHIENKRFQMITFRLNDSVPKHVIEQWKETLNHLTGSQVGSQVGPQVSVPASTSSPPFTSASPSSQVSAPAQKGSRVSTPAPQGSQVPAFAKEKNHQQKIHRLIKLIDQYEDAGIGECLLRDDRIAQIVQDTLLFNHQKKYEMICWCIMPNHVHTLIAPVEGMSLSEIMYDWKSYTTHAINKALNRKGKVWMMEYFDRFIRDNDHFQKVVNYIHNNPVKAGLVADPTEWRWSSAGSGSQVNTPAPTGSQVSALATTTGSQVSAPAPTTGSQVSALATTVSTPATKESISSSAGSETLGSINTNPHSAGRETCGPTYSEKQQSL